MIKRLIISLAAVVFLLGGQLQPAHAQLKGSTSLLEQAGTAAYGEDAFKQQKSLGEIIGGIIQVILSITGLILVLLLIYGGYIWMLARGNEGEVERAKDIIRNAIIGIVIVMLALAITTFVLKGLNQATGSNFSGLPVPEGGE